MLSSYLMHSRYTAHIAKKLSEEGFTTVTFDQRGQGLSEGDRGQWNDYKAIIQDAYNFIKKVFEMYPKAPIFVLGTGISAVNILYISLYFYKDFKFAGIIMASPILMVPQYGKIF